ncbi:MAG: helix-turn-helix domain-containing protein, partial [Gammaproteobacteria bacterium]
MSALMAEQEQNEGIQLAVPGLGDRLRAARMACNLDLAKLAARIHLTADVVDAIERDDYAEMPARVFVRGYVRNYARAVNLPAESVLAQFDRLWPDEQQGVKRQEPPSLASDVSARRRWPRLVTWLVVLAAIGLPLVWWQG